MKKKTKCSKNIFCLRGKQPSGYVFLILFGFIIFFFIEQKEQLQKWPICRRGFAILYYLQNK